MSYAAFLNFRFFLFFLFAAQRCMADNLTHEVVDIFGDLPDDLNVYDSVQDLVDRLVGRLRCGQYGIKESVCKSCLKTSRILELLQIEQNKRFLTKPEIVGISVIFLHYLLHFPMVCTVESQGCTDYSACREEVFYQMKAGTSQEVLENVLRQVKKVMESGDIRKCFGAGAILLEVEKMPFVDDDEKLAELITSLMKHIFSGRCIDVEESLTDFLDDIFHMYGSKCESVISVDGLKKMMHVLQNGKNHNHHNQGEHDHNHDHDHHNHHHGDHDHDDDHDHDHHHHHEDCEHYGKSNELLHEYHLSTHDENDHDEDGSHHGHKHHNDNYVNEQMDTDLDRNHSDTNFQYEGFSSNHKNPSKSENYANGASINNERNLTTIEIQNQSYSINANESEHNNGWMVNRSNISGLFTFEPTFRPVDTNKMIAPSINDSSTYGYALPKTPSEMYVRNFTLFENSNESSGPVSVTSNMSDDNATSTVFGNSNMRAAAHDIGQDISLQNDDLEVASAMHSEHVQHADNNNPYNDNVHRVYLHGKDDQTSSLEYLFEHEGEVHEHTSLAAKCLSVEELITKFGRVSNNSLTKLEFLQLCPALVQQVVSGVCQNRVQADQKQPSNWELYGYSTLAVFLISLTSLAGVVLLPILAKQVYYYVMAGCIGLAFSTLAGDALLHLIPQALGVHSHTEGDHSDWEDNHSHGESIDPTLWKQLAVFAAVYLLYVFESCVCAFSKNSHHSHNQNGHGHSHIPDALPKELTLVSIKVKSESNTQLAMSPECSTSLDTEIAETDTIKKASPMVLSTPTFCGLSTVALLITLGDSIHNFGDGLAIGAAFSSGIRSGLSTSIAVFCHELPHEFGDFVILISSGLSFSKALWINFLSGLTCLIGLYIGIQVGDNETARAYILAVTAGIFLYVALTEMLPELKENKKGSPIKMLIMKNIGIITGIVIMVMISIYEHKLTI